MLKVDKYASQKALKRTDRRQNFILFFFGELCTCNWGSRRCKKREKCQKQRDKTTTIFKLHIHTAESVETANNNRNCTLKINGKDEEGVSVCVLTVLNFLFGFESAVVVSLVLLGWEVNGIASSACRIFALNRLLRLIA